MDMQLFWKDFDDRRAIINGIKKGLRRLAYTTEVSAPIVHEGETQEQRETAHYSDRDQMILAKV